MKKVLLIGALAVLALTGCGGGAVGNGDEARADLIDRTELERSIKRDVNLKLLAAGGGKATVLCVQEGTDGLHFACDVDVTGNDSYYGGSLVVTCDKSGGCVWKEG